MRKLLVIVGLCLAIPVPRLWAGISCGDEGLLCSNQDRCCEHVIATFSGDPATSMPSYVKGQCIPHENKCTEFWCGNRECKSSLFGTPSVCCIYTPQGGEAEYACAYSELNCRGNSRELSIRQKEPSRSAGNSLQ